MHTKSLIRNIESLSTTLSAKQLSQFLDIMDEMAKLVEQAHGLPASGKTALQDKLPQTATQLH